MKKQHKKSNKIDKYEAMRNSDNRKRVRNYFLIVFGIIVASVSLTSIYYY